MKFLKNTMIASSGRQVNDAPILGNHVEPPSKVNGINGSTAGNTLAAG